jgi:transposase
MATVQLRNPTEGCGYFDREKASGKTANEAMRALKRRLSDIVLWHMVDDANAHTVTGPGRTPGNVNRLQRDRLEFHAGFSEKSLPGPAIIKA